MMATIRIVTLSILVAALTGCLGRGNPGSPAWLRTATEEEILRMDQETRDGVCKAGVGDETVEKVMLRVRLLTSGQIENLRRRRPHIDFPQVGDTRCHIFALMVASDSSEYPEVVREYTKDGHQYQVLREAMGLTFGGQSKLGAEGCREFLLRDNTILGVKPCPPPP